MPQFLLCQGMTHCHFPALKTFGFIPFCRAADQCYLLPLHPLSFLEDICELIQCGGAEISICEKATVANALSAPVPKVTFNRA